MQATSINSVNANVTAANSSIAATNANVTAANIIISQHTANVASLFSITGTQDANLGTASTNITGLRANITAANAAIAAVTVAWTANAVTQADALATLTSNAAVQSGNISTLTTTVGQHTANVASLFSITSTQDANLGTATTNITGLRANITAANAAIAAITVTTGNIATVPQLTANILAVNVTIAAANALASSATTTANTAMKTYVDAKVISAGTYGNTQVAAYIGQNPPPGTYGNTQVNTYITSETGIYANVIAANLEISNLRANITSANAVIASFASTLSNTVSNVSAVTVAWTANAVAQDTLISALRANITSANSAITTLQTQVFANANVATYLVGNISSGNIFATSYRYANGLSILTGISSTYSNANVIANLQNLTTNVTTTGNVTAANVYAANFLYANGSPYIGGGNVTVINSTAANLTVVGAFYQGIESNVNANTSVITLDTLTAGVFFLSNLTSNIIINLANVGIQGNAGGAGNTTIVGNTSSTIGILINQGATPYAISNIRVNGNAITTVFPGGQAPAGVASFLQNDRIDLVRSANVWTAVVARVSPALDTWSGNITAGNVISNGNIAMTSNVTRNVFVNSYAPLTTQGNVGDIWYQTF